MGRFVFRLQPVYDLRKHAEKEQQDALARERQKLLEIERAGAALQAAFGNWSAAYVRSAREGMTPPEALRISNYIDELGHRLEENQKQAQQQNGVVEKERLLLIEKMKERKTLDKLYEKQLNAYREAERLRDEQEIEERVAGRYEKAE